MAKGSGTLSVTASRPTAANIAPPAQDAQPLSGGLQAQAQPQQVAADPAVEPLAQALGVTATEAPGRTQLNQGAPVGMANAQQAQAAQGQRTAMEQQQEAQRRQAMAGQPQTIDAGDYGQIPAVNSYGLFSFAGGEPSTPAPTHTSMGPMQDVTVPANAPVDPLLTGRGGGASGLSNPALVEALQGMASPTHANMGAANVTPGTHQNMGTTNIAPTLAAGGFSMLDPGQGLSITPGDGGLSLEERQALYGTAGGAQQSLLDQGQDARNLFSGQGPVAWATGQSLGAALDTMDAISRAANSDENAAAATSSATQTNAETELNRVLAESGAPITNDRLNRSEITADTFMPGGDQHRDAEADTFMPDGGPPPPAGAIERLINSLVTGAADAYGAGQSAWDRSMGPPPPGMLEQLQDLQAGNQFAGSDLSGAVNQNMMSAMSPDAWRQMAANREAELSQNARADLNLGERRLRGSSARTGTGMGGSLASLYGGHADRMQQGRRDIFNDALGQQMQALGMAGSHANAGQAMDQARWAQQQSQLMQALGMDQAYAQDNYTSFGEALGGVGNMLGGLTGGAAGAAGGLAGTAASLAPLLMLL